MLHDSETFYEAGLYDKRIEFRMWTTLMSFEFVNYLRVNLWNSHTERFRRNQSKVPHSETILTCRDCFALGYIDCEFCSKLPIKCYECSKENSNKCDCCIQKQRKECKNCDGKGILKCKTCEGRGRLLQSKVLHIKFKGYKNHEFPLRFVTFLIQLKQSARSQIRLNSLIPK